MVTLKAVREDANPTPVSALRFRRASWDHVGNAMECDIRALPHVTIAAPAGYQSPINTWHTRGPNGGHGDATFLDFSMVYG